MAAPWIRGCGGSYGLVQKKRDQRGDLLMRAVNTQSSPSSGGQRDLSGAALDCARSQLPSLPNTTATWRLVGSTQPQFQLHAQKMCRGLSIRERALELIPVVCDRG